MRGIVGATLQSPRPGCGGVSSAQCWFRESDGGLPGVCILTGRFVPPSGGHPVHRLPPRTAAPFALLFLVLLAAAAPAGAQPAAAPAAPPAVPKVEFEHYTLPNGLDVILHVDRKLPIVH